MDTQMFIGALCTMVRKWEKPIENIMLSESSQSQKMYYTIPLVYDVQNGQISRDKK